MSIQVRTWNSQGNKGDEMWTNLAWPPAVGGGDDLLIFVCEAGTPPWVTPGLPEVQWGHTYEYQAGKAAGADWVNNNAAGGSVLQTALDNWNAGVRGHGANAWWVPWQVYVNAPPSLRCSLAMYWFPAARSSRVLEFSTKQLVESDFAGRPVLAAELRKPTFTECVALFAHLPANQKTAAAALLDLAQRADTVLAEGTRELVAGDLNIDAFKPLTLPAGWRSLLTGKATHDKGKQLDWGMANRLLPMNAPTITWSAKKKPIPGKPVGISDHAMLAYTLPFD